MRVQKNHYGQFMLLACLISKKGLKFLGLSFLLSASFLMIFLLLLTHANAATRIKDIVQVEGIRDNQLVGYGLVVGLNGTGDKLNNTPFAEKSLKAFLARMGVNTADLDLKSRNVAAVTLTSNMPAFARAGARIDVTVSTMGDAKNLSGGTLVATPLMGADGNLYAVAQGQVAIGGFTSNGESGTTISKGVTTSGFISNGAIIEREIAFELDQLKTINFALRNPDISTAKRIAMAINQEMNAGIAKANDPGTVQVVVPDSYQSNVAMMLAQIEQLEVVPDQAARIIIDEASGTIVMNENVSIDTVAIAQGNLVVKVTETPQVSQPGALSGGATAVTNASAVEVTEGKNEMAILEKGASLRELVDGLNALGVGPRDLITILQTIKSAGALQAEIEMR